MTSSPIEPWPDDPLPEIATRVAHRPVVVLDDDPTGTQTVRDATVLTAWDAHAIAGHLDESLLFLSTNSRALDETAAVELCASAASSAREAGAIAGRPLTIVSRSDSTLRGHFPAETLAIGETDSRVLLAPYFGEGGRLTRDDVHVLVRGDERINVADTEFALDATFGYRARDLRAWVAERYAASGRPAPPMTSLPLGLIRRYGPGAVADALLDLAPGGVAVVNAELERDIEVVALGALKAEEAGLPLVARTAASYVRARAGRAPSPLLAPGELGTSGPGLVVVGSHSELTTRQLDALRESPAGTRLTGVDLTVEPLVAGGAAADAAIADAARRLELAIAAGHIGLLSTERTRREIGLEGSRAVAAALVSVIGRIETRPGWVISKGGITGFEVASRGLRMREARIAGQLLPGVSVWIGGVDSRWPKLQLVVFPGNVGDDGALRRAAELMSGA